MSIKHVFGWNFEDMYEESGEIFNRCKTFTGAVKKAFEALENWRDYGWYEQPKYITISEFKAVPDTTGEYAFEVDDIYHTWKISIEKT